MPMEHTENIDIHDTPNRNDCHDARTKKQILISNINSNLFE